MGLRGPVKQFHKESRIDLTELQMLHLRLSAAAGNESVASVLRRLISADLRRRLLQEVAGGRQ